MVVLKILLTSYYLLLLEFCQTHIEWLVCISIVNTDSCSLLVSLNQAMNTLFFPAIFLFIFFAYCKWLFVIYMLFMPFTPCSLSLLH